MVGSGCASDAVCHGAGGFPCVQVGVERRECRADGAVGAGTDQRLADSRPRNGVSVRELVADLGQEQLGYAVGGCGQRGAHAPW